MLHLLKRVISPKTPLDPQEQIYNEALSFLGTKEIAGEQHNPKIIEFFKQVGHSWVLNDETAWCAAFVGAILETCGYEGTGKLNARSYLDWGRSIPLMKAKRGDVVIFWRSAPDSWKGHVAFFDHADENYIYVLGGNQCDAVSVARYAKDRFLGVRRAVI